MDLLSALAYLGGQPRPPAPLDRFLPPVPDGMATGFLAGHASPGAWVLDPFGASPQLVVELARSGCRVLVAVNNPVTRFLLEMEARPPGRDELQSALAELASAFKGEERVEALLQSIYLTECPRCRRSLPAQAFIWERGAAVPCARILRCPCGESGEFPATPADQALAEQMETQAKFHRPRALERVVALTDPDRANVEEALACYLPRAIYALITLVNKLDGLALSPARRRLLSALLLTAFDEANGLWSQPADRPRPKQLSLPPRFLEKNVWMALEAGVEAWSGTGAALPLTVWPELPQGDSGICIFEGPVRSLAPHLQELPPHALVTVVPRPNQAFWTLSALWTGWLWGREAVTPFKSVLSRRRYDWNWHAAALYAALKNLVPHLPLRAPFFALLTEAEPSYLTAVLLAASGAGFDLTGIAMRTRLDPLQLLWSRRAMPLPMADAIDPENVRQTMEACLLQRGEPVHYLGLHAAGLCALSEEHAIAWQKEALGNLNAPIQAALGTGGFIHYGGDAPETGLWAAAAPDDQQEALPDRVEKMLVTYLQVHPASSFADLEMALNNEMRGLFTPPLGLIRAVLASYAQESGGTWSLRAEDSPSTRRSDLEAATAHLVSLAAQLGVTAVRADREGRLILWQERDELLYAYHLTASAVVSRLILKETFPPGRCLLVLPGGRAGLLAAKLRRDPRLEAAWGGGWRVLKFRQLRQMEGSGKFDRARWEKALREDPLETPEQLKMF